MISYCPLDLTDEQPVVRKPQVVREKVKIRKNEHTECNYLVMFFILGVFVLAATDTIAK